MPWKACLFVAVLAGLPHAAMAQSNQQCQSRSVTTRAHFVSEAVSRNAALTAWPIRAAALYGPMWANWTNAANKSVTCRLRTMPTGLNGYLCHATARPCILQ